MPVLQPRPRTIIWAGFAVLCTVTFIYKLQTSTPRSPARVLTTTDVSSLFGAYNDPLLFPPLPARGGYYQPPVPAFNTPPADNNRTRTPLFIPFTRNHKILSQCILSYIASGWPRSDIIVIDNSGTMDANLNEKLTAKNPFYLNYATFRGRYGVNILRTPTLLTFSQLQNFMMSTAMSYGWGYYYWGHSDVAVLSWEEKEPYKSLWQNVVHNLAELLVAGEKEKDWAVRLFTSDYLTLINVDAMRRVQGGGWDVFIPYYFSDCDFWARVRFSGLTIEEEKVGDVFDLADHVNKPEEMFFARSGPGGEGYKIVKTALTELERTKKEGVRNRWQDELQSRVGDAWSYGPGFQPAWWKMSGWGGETYKAKWNSTECELRGLKTAADMWKPQEA